MSLLVVVVVGLVVIAALLARFGPSVVKRCTMSRSSTNFARPGGAGGSGSAARRAMDDAAGQSWRARFDPAEPGNCGVQLRASPRR